jgi:Domain of unknown function (DUF3597)
MKVFGNIMSAIFSGGTKGPAIEASHNGSVVSPPTAASAMPPSSGAWGPVDVDMVVTRLAGRKNEKLDWRTSIVDLMKALDLDSSLAARKELARELHYPGDMSDTAAMNVWLHKQVMLKLEQHGGKVPEQLRS